MPKKKNASSVIGTVSTRSTRRESVSNVDITPKTKVTLSSPKSSKATMNRDSTVTKRRLARKNKTVLDILKDWSDGDSSQDEKTLISEKKTSRKCANVPKSTKDNSKQGDNQSLIDILEGNQPSKRKPKIRYVKIRKEGISKCINIDSQGIAEIQDSDEEDEDDCIIIGDSDDQCEEITIECVDVPEESAEIIIGEESDETSSIEMKSVDIKVYPENSSTESENDVYEEGSTFSVPIEEDEVICTTANVDTCNIEDDEDLEEKDTEERTLKQSDDIIEIHDEENSGKVENTIVCGPMSFNEAQNEDESMKVEKVKKKTTDIVLLDQESVDSSEKTNLEEGTVEKKPTDVDLQRLDQESIDSPDKVNLVIENVETTLTEQHLQPLDEESVGSPEKINLDEEKVENKSMDQHIQLQNPQSIESSDKLKLETCNSITSDSQIEEIFECQMDKEDVKQTLNCSDSPMIETNTCQVDVQNSSVDVHKNDSCNLKNDINEVVKSPSIEDKEKTEEDNADSKSTEKISSKTNDLLNKKNDIDEETLCTELAEKVGFLIENQEIDCMVSDTAKLNITGNKTNEEPVNIDKADATEIPDTTNPIQDLGKCIIQEPKETHFPDDAISHEQHTAENNTANFEKEPLSETIKTGEVINMEINDSNVIQTEDSNIPEEIQHVETMECNEKSDEVTIKIPKSTPKTKGKKATKKDNEIYFSRGVRRSARNKETQNDLNTSQETDKSLTETENKEGENEEINSTIEEQIQDKIEHEKPTKKEEKKTKKEQKLNKKEEKKSQKEGKQIKTPRPKNTTTTKDNKVKTKKETKPKLQGDSKKKKNITKKTKEKSESETHEPDKTEKTSLKVDVDNSEEIRRSSRIKSISVLKKRSTGFGLVRSKSDSGLNESELSDSNSGSNEFDKSNRSTPTSSPKCVNKEKLSKARTKSNENITSDVQMSDTNKAEIPSSQSCRDQDKSSEVKSKDTEVEGRLRQFVHLKENLYKTDRQTCKEAKKMTCDCFLTEDDVKNKQYGCGEDCLNRLLMIECGLLCQVADRCTNKRFQKGQFAPVEVFKTEKKGLGLRAAANIPYGEFILEYVGEVLNVDEFEKRAENYSQDKNIHYYFMSLRSDAVIDATMKGNISRFINHSCDPNAETQKWTVNGELRIGFFSTRTILAGEEITFDYRFQRYGKEAQKCYCEAAICRGWLGESPDDDESEEDEEDEDETEEQSALPEATSKSHPASDATSTAPEQRRTDQDALGDQQASKKPDNETVGTKTTEVKRKSPRRKPRKDKFEELDQLDEEIEMLVTTGLKNQAHTLKLSRMMVRAKEPEQRKKLLRILRKGELPCKRLFLDYHGLKLMHGYMIDAQHLANSDRKFDSLRLELLQTLAVLPIQNKTMLQDSKVFPTVESWATNKNILSPEDSESNSPKSENDIIQSTNPEIRNEEIKDSSVTDQEEEIKFLASKLLEEWANLKEMFRIPKKERIEQMKEHEREANKKFMASSYSQDQEKSKKTDSRYRNIPKYKTEREPFPKKGKFEERDRPSAAFLKISKHERRKLFALQVELREEERRLKQRELWRQHELNCLMIGTDPRFTAPFDPGRGYQYIWNPTMGQWQTYPLPQVPNQSTVYNTSTTNQGLSLGNVNTPQRTGMLGYNSQIGVQPPSSMINLQALQGSSSQQLQVPQLNIPGISNPLSSAHTTAVNYQDVKKEEDPTQVKFAGPIPPLVKLPPKWKCGKDKYGRPYYYHIKIRKSQWEPPPLPPNTGTELSESSSSTESSSLTSDSSSDNSESEDDIDDTRLLLEVRKQMEKSSNIKHAVCENVKKEETVFSPEIKNESEEDPEETEDMEIEGEESKPSSIDIRLKEQFNLLKEKDYKPVKKKRRVGLCQEIMISPRSEQDRIQFREDLKRYKANKEKLKRQKELIMQQTRKKLRESSENDKKPNDKRSKNAPKSRVKEKSNWNNDAAKKIKETFRSNMASTVVSALNIYRKPDCKEGKITNTDDFKHLARKLTHFVMLKEMKHIDRIEDLTCTDNVKGKAREYIKKYMSKFGECYQKRHDEPDFKD